MCKLYTIHYLCNCTKDLEIAPCARDLTHRIGPLKIPSRLTSSPLALARTTTNPDSYSTNTCVPPSPKIPSTTNIKTLPTKRFLPIPIQESVYFITFTGLKHGERYSEQKLIESATRVVGETWGCQEGVLVREQWPKVACPKCWRRQWLINRASGRRKERRGHESKLDEDGGALLAGLEKSWSWSWSLGEGGEIMERRQTEVEYCVGLGFGGEEIGEGAVRRMYEGIREETTKIGGVATASNEGEGGEKKEDGNGDGDGDVVVGGGAVVDNVGDGLGVGAPPESKKPR